MAKHVHAEAIKAWADGARIEAKLPDEKHWHLVAVPFWELHHSYRVYDKWREVKEARAAGAVVEYRVQSDCPWNDVTLSVIGAFNWPPNFEYRIKPEKVEKKVYADQMGCTYVNRTPTANLKLTFEDDKLVAAEVL